MTTLNLLRRHGRDLTRAEAKAVVAKMVDECSDHDVDLVEAGIADVVTHIRGFRGPGQTGEIYVFRYKDMVWTGQTFEQEDGERPTMVYAPSGDHLELPEVSQIWKIVRRSKSLSREAAANS